METAGNTTANTENQDKLENLPTTPQTPPNTPNQKHPHPEIKKHPLYRNYGADEEGGVWCVKHHKNRQCKLSITNTGRKIVSVCDPNNGVRKKSVLVSRFVYECHNNTLIQKGMTVDHIDNDKMNDRPDNLQCLSLSENIKKKYRDGYTNKGHLKKPVIGWCVDNPEQVFHFKSMTSAGREFGICSPCVRNVCENKQPCSVSKKDGKEYSFKYEPTKQEI